MVGPHTSDTSRPRVDVKSRHQLDDEIPVSPMVQAVENLRKSQEVQTPRSAAGGGDAFSLNAEFDVVHTAFWKSSEFWLKAGSVVSLVVVTFVAFVIPIFLVIYNTAGTITYPRPPTP